MKNHTESPIKLSADKPNIVVGFTNINCYIGNKGDLPWKRNLKGDMKFVSKLIRLDPKSAVIVGRKTYETLPKMEGVNLFVITSNSCISGNVKTFKSLQDAVESARNAGMTVIIFGGERIYREALKTYACKLFCTVVKEGDLVGDAYFPHCKLELTNISKAVDEFLCSETKTWELRDEELFVENGFEYSFFTGESNPDSK